MEPESIAASAVVSAAVAWFVASHVTVRQERAKHYVARMQQLREAVEPLQRKLARYRYGTRRTVAERQEYGPMHVGDVEDVGRIYRIAEGLSPLRRRLIERRLRAIYGNSSVDMVRDYPTSPEADGLQAWFGSALLGAPTFEDPREALLHRTYATPPSMGGGKKLARQLRLLARGR